MAKKAVLQQAATYRPLTETELKMFLQVEQNRKIVDLINSVDLNYADYKKVTTQGWAIRTDVLSVLKKNIKKYL